MPLTVPLLEGWRDRAGICRTSGSWPKGVPRCFARITPHKAASGKAEARPRPGQPRGAACSWSGWAQPMLLASGDRFARARRRHGLPRRWRREFCEPPCAVPLVRTPSRWARAQYSSATGAFTSSGHGPTASGRESPAAWSIPAKHHRFGHNLFRQHPVFGKGLNRNR
jgi:hypothetical protein